MMALISPSRRLRRTWFFESVEAAGVKAYTVYNRMSLPKVFDVNVAYGMVRMTHCDAGTPLLVQTPESAPDAVAREEFWL